MTGAEAPSDRPVFSADGDIYTWSDVIAAARLGGEWTCLERQVQAGLACVHRSAATGEAADRALIEGAAKQFRYDRGLLAGDDLEAWFVRWDLRVADWRDYLVRASLRERWSEELDRISVERPVEPEAVASAIWPEAVCSGELTRWARTLAGDVALSIESSEMPAGSHAETLPRVLVIADRIRSAHGADGAVEREVVTHRLEWQRVDGELLDFGSVDAAREAALLIREDGRSMEEVVTATGVDRRPYEAYLSEVPDAHAIPLRVAGEGDLVGPLEQDGRYWLILVRRNERPSPVDPAIRRKAFERLVERAIERAIDAHVTWHEHL